ncbi:hypothetical protein [Brevibacillus formosus]
MELLQMVARLEPIDERRSQKALCVAVQNKKERQGIAVTRDDLSVFLCPKDRQKPWIKPGQN